MREGYRNRTTTRGAELSRTLESDRKLTTGQIVEMVAQIFAALQSLPGAPVATRETSTDVANLILFQKALADHAKRDEQVRTLGSLVAKLVG